MDDYLLMSFSTVFQAYQGSARVIMKGPVQWNRFWLKDFHLGNKSKTARSIGQHVTH